MSEANGLSADTQALMAFEAGKKSAGLAFVLWFFTGGLGGHRFYLGQTTTAIVQLMMSIIGWLTVWFVFGLLFLIPLGIWLIVDLFLISGMVESHNSALMNRLKGSSAARPAGSTVDELSKFAALRDSGAITDEEYQAQKERLIGVAPAKPTVVDAPIPDAV